MTTTLHLIDYATLVDATDDESTRATVAAAFGPDGLGVLAVTGVPPELTEKRLKLLGLARKLGTLPGDELARFERPELYFCAGWSRGREKFRGKVDTAKGSWRAARAALFFARPTDAPRRRGAGRVAATLRVRRG